MFAVAAVLYAFSPTILRVIGAQLIHADPLQRSDAVIVLAPFLDRVLEGADLYRSGYAPVVILTRGQRDEVEGELIERGIIGSLEDRRRQALIALGVPAEAILVLAPLADSTADEAQAFANWAKTHSVRRVIVVTSPPHTARSRLTFMRAVEKLSIEVLMRPSTRNKFRSDTWWHSRDTFRDGVLELQKLVYYRLIELPRLVPPAPGAAKPS